MNTKKPQLYFLLSAIIGTFVLAFFIFRPFLYALALAAVFAVIFQSTYQKIVRFARGQKGLAAFATILIVVIFIFVPLTFLGVQILQESQQLYFSLADGNGKDTVLAMFNNLMDNLQKYFPAMKEFSVDVDQYVKQALGWLIQHLGSIFSGFVNIIAGSFIFIFSLYYLLKDGPKLKAAIINLSPLSDNYDEAISKKLEMAIGSVVKGNLLIALIQGILTMAGFMIFGVPNPVLWGSVAAIAALIPNIGTTLVIFPAILFLLLEGEIFYGIGLAVWGVSAVGLIDNFLGPKLVGRGMRLHPLIILLSVLGGIAFFGPVGFLLGPLAMSLFFALLDIYSLVISEKPVV